VSDTARNPRGGGGTAYLVYPDMHLRYGFLVTDTVVLLPLAKDGLGLVTVTPALIMTRCLSPTAYGCCRVKLLIEKSNHWWPIITDIGIGGSPA